MSDFHVVPGPAVAAIIAEDPARLRRIAIDTYRTHEQGRTVNPDSYFLRFPDRPDSRVIALPAYHGGEVDRIGVKWISSFPANLQAGLPRASAVLILNDYETGRPIACLEAAGISAARTAASAAVAAEALGGSGPRSVSVVGAGPIARAVLAQIADTGIDITELSCFDLDRERALSLLDDAAEITDAARRPARDLADACTSDLVVFATTAAKPYVPADTPFRPGQLLLNVSLRDLAPETILQAANFVDDVDHCLKADTSPHLAEQLTGGREFITGTIGAVLAGDVEPVGDRPIIFSPFGLGVLDIAVGSHVLDEAVRRGTAVPIPSFFA
ncbi:2,3-diaminopropionate biosynthesis protein SbnB [Glycomyces sp. TRM65418]|uniref:2,3-diaminopropionate biosynthesis protein SbnB n=1 Tax=Glycomyces sp. TRM65418 TaxID=2867006 RepID=UPI001CE6832F|nr:2,3-diaminopropionate biosynthesis protein SbnB [Glycomyces sp. TRM65418]MCC3761581.1 2,3-diaminopropionate biosynthesis protein SbnB [Glycomyces sp. TRM65418]QZD55676.1 2,3-diaminopropionate biosynthesis protein SbnB [Glycomyces sp. TRM65418]